MFDLSGSKILFLIIIALVVLGPDKLPEAMRKAGKVYGDFKRMTSGFQNEMKSVLDEPMRELRETAELAKKSAMFDTSSLTSSLNAVVKPQSGSMAAVTPVTPVAAAPPVAAPVESVGMTEVPEATPVPAPLESVVVEPVFVEPVVVEPVVVEPMVVEPVSSTSAVRAATGATLGDRTSRRLAGTAATTAGVAGRANVEHAPEPAAVEPGVETAVRQPVSEEASFE